MSGSFQTFGSKQKMEGQFPFFPSVSAVGDQCYNCKMNWNPEYPMMTEEYNLQNNKIPGLLVFFCFWLFAFPAEFWPPYP